MENKKRQLVQDINRPGASALVGDFFIDLQSLHGSIIIISDDIR
jgi:hypothetical protein